MALYQIVALIQVVVIMDMIYLCLHQVVKQIVHWYFKNQISIKYVLIAVMDVGLEIVQLEVFNIFN